jgi:FixJ family two-component response regulator
MGLVLLLGPYAEIADGNAVTIKVMPESNMTQKTVIHIIDDEESIRTSLSRLLRAAGYEVCVYPSAGEFLLSNLDGALGCILLDVCMPGPSGLELQQALSRRAQPLPIIFMTGYGDIQMTVNAMKAGAADFLTKPVKRTALLAAIESALARDAETRTQRDETRRWLECFNSLTARERQVFEGVVAGKLNKQIAAELGTAERTVKAHRAQVMGKMSVGSLAELVHIADRLNTSTSAANNQRASA